MNTNEELIHTFYSAFQTKDYQTMQHCYSDEAYFTDPIFKKINSEQVRAMWKMFCLKSKDLSIEYKHVKCNEYFGTAEWSAIYSFSKSGRQVTNHIKSHFIFENGKICKQVDTFNFYRWSRQALGLTGILFGWSSLLKNKIRYSAKQSLLTFINNELSS
jgi:ketosteroid isomerase-like protein